MTINAPADIVNVSLTLPGAGRVVVTVLDTHGDPLVGQTVFRLAGSPCAGIPQVTDGAGIAIFEEVPVPGGSFKAILDDDVAEGSATIQREGDAAALTLRFSGFGTVSGTVLDDQGEPALGATVILGAKRLDLGLCTFLRDSRAAAVETGLDGTFVFEHIPVGVVSVSASTVFFPIPATGRDSLLFDGELPRLHSESVVFDSRRDRFEPILSRKMLYSGISENAATSRPWVLRIRYTVFRFNKDTRHVA